MGEEYYKDTFLQNGALNRCNAAFPYNTRMDCGFADIMSAAAARRVSRAAREVRKFGNLSGAEKIMSDIF